ncbi:MAG: ECF transporter S component [Clostridia bacterium]|nr:ECF transporter S component [Clostridia bacterium]
MKNTAQKIVMSALLAALTCVATMIIRLPSPLGGYINLGDAVVLASAFLLPNGYMFLSAGLGSALADLFAGYIAYAPATFVIKGLMTIIAFGIYKAVSKKTKPDAAMVLGSIVAELWMIGGYLIFESFLYGFVPSLINVPANAVQGVAGIIIGLMLTKFFKKTKIFW